MEKRVSILKIKAWKQKIQYFIYSKRMATKMSVFMISIVTLALFLAIGIFQICNKQILYENTKETALTNLTSAKTLIENTIENINTYSYICLSNSAVQQGLGVGRESIDNFRNIEKIESSLTETIAKIDLIESIYIFDREKFLCYSDKSGNHTLLYNEIQSYDWYSKVSPDGKYHVMYHCKEFFKNRDKVPGILFVRAIRSLDSMRTIGYMVINVSQEVVDNILLELENNEFQMKFHIFSDCKHVLFNTLEKEIQEKVQKLGLELIDTQKYSAIYPIDTMRCQVSVYESKDLIYIGLIPLDDIQKQSRNNLLLIVLFVVQAIIVMIAALFISHWYTHPIEMLMESMEGIKRGEFKRIEIKTRHYEVLNLIDGYNKMMGEIQELLDKTKRVESQKRKADLEVLSVQMNPHFLYNTFDSIKSLFLLKRYEDAYRMMCKLSQFYKISLSKGDEYISIEKEVQMVANYVEIQKMRYGEKIQVYFEVSKQVEEYKILKLILQPLVENAIVHGIHGFVENGIINVRIKEESECLYLEVEDNGIGMSESTLADILQEKNIGKEKSFGLMGTIRRLAYCYGEEMRYKVVSKIHQGTRISICIPIKNLHK